MLNKIKACVEQFHMITPGDHVVAGVSGGADSVCLLFVLLELQKSISFTLSVAHINHGIRQEAGEDALFVEQMCREQGVPFFLFQTDVKTLSKEKRISEEEAGREFRYRCFDEVLKQDGKIAVAHQMEDGAETMLFNLFRGSGLRGMAGIRPVRENIIRPLLFISRQEIEDFLEERHLIFRTDHTNLEDIYTRNRIRHHILTCAEKINPGAVRHMSETAGYLREAEEYIRKQTEKIAGSCVVFSSGRAEIDLKVLLRQEPLIRKTILMHTLEQVIPGRKDIGSSHINELLYLAGCEGNRETCLPCGYLGRKEYDRIIIRKASPAVIGETSRNEPGRQENRLFPVIGPNGVNGPDQEMKIPDLKILAINLFPYGKSEIIPQKTYTKWFDYDKITTSAIFRTRKPGDYLVINREGNKKTLKEYMIHEKIVREEREKLYVLADASHIMWIPGYRISEYYKITDQTRLILEIIAEPTDEKMDES